MLAVIEIVVRHFVIRGGLEGGAKMLDFSPRQLAENVALFASGLLFFGNTIWVFAHQSSGVLAMVGGACLAATALIAIGLVRRARLEPAPSRWIWFFVVGLIIAAFPTILLYHVSEMYVPPMILPFAMLGGIAVDGLASTRAGRGALFVIAPVALMSSVLTIRGKVDGLVDVGLRAEAQLRQVLSFIPPDTRDRRILLLFDERELPPRRTYSVFRMGDEILLVHELTPDWYRPGDDLKLQSFAVPDPAAAAKSDLANGYDYVLLWDAAAQRFTRLR
jgi:hypothetical protein